MIKKIFSSLSPGLGIDLGTDNTLIYLKGKGIVINEPSIVALNKKTGEVLAVGEKAKEMLGKTPEHLEAIHPISHGIISDFELTEEMLKHFLQRIKKITKSFFPYRPIAIATVPCNTTDVERKAVEDSILNSGISKVYLIEEPIASAIGARLPIFESSGNIIIDIGSGNSEIAVISLGGIVSSQNLKIAGKKFNDDIIKYLRDEYKLLIGEPTAEKIKLEIGSALPLPNEKLKMNIRGRDLTSGLPREISITNREISRALENSIRELLEAIHSIIEEIPPELISDIYTRNIWLSGGGCEIRGLDKVIEESCGIKTKKFDDPHTSSVRGLGFVLENLDKYKDILIYENEN
jgi:rod shape-determining protein MreB